METPSGAGLAPSFGDSMRMSLLPSWLCLNCTETTCPYMCSSMLGMMSFPSQPLSQHERAELSCSRERHWWHSPCVTPGSVCSTGSLDMRRSDLKPPWSGEALLQNLERNPKVPKHFCRRTPAPVSVEQSRRAAQTCHPALGTSARQVKTPQIPALSSNITYIIYNI